MHLCVCVPTQMWYVCGVCVGTCMCEGMCMHLCVCAYLHVGRVHMCVHVCEMCVLMCVCVCSHTYMHGAFQTPVRMYVYVSCVFMEAPVSV